VERTASLATGSPSPDDEGSEEESAPGGSVSLRLVLVRTPQFGRVKPGAHRAARLAGHPASRNIEHPLKKILLYRPCNQFTDELANPNIS
jgi:hypothetical protein